MKHLIIGTAGHVDHGKTALVKALTGIDTDRLKEEKERGISIELGFAELTLPGGRRAGIVDVPGHERFIKNMLAGAGGFDLVMLVIAADEGVMPQTREHLDIIQLLQVNRGVVVITKADQVEEDWLGLVMEEVREFLQGTVLENAPIVTTSAVTGQGLKELLSVLDLLAEEAVSREESGPPRLPVDRVFSITGFGTVVTGTLLAGVLRIGDTVEVQPQGLVSRVRSLQVHGKKVEAALAGQRVAVNLTGLEVEEIERGSVVAGPQSLKPSFRLDARIILLKGAARQLKNRARVRFYLGTKETLGRVVLLNREELEPGTTDLAQFELEEAVVAGRGDRFVIRSYSPMTTIGGGTVIDPSAKKHRRFREDIIDALATMERGTPDELAQQYLSANPAFHLAEDVASATGLPQPELEKAIAALTESGGLKKIAGEGKVYLVAADVYKKWASVITGLVESYNKEYPLREGYPREELRSRKFSSFNPKLFQFLLQALEQDGLIRAMPQVVASPGFLPGPGAAMEKALASLTKIFRKAGFQPPSWGEACQEAGLKESEGQEVLQYLLRTGEMVKITDDFYFDRDTLSEARRLLAGHLKEKGEIMVGELRDLLKTSRKFALPLLEYFDREKVTRRVGDKRLPGRALAPGS
ncbi:MAG: selenocysteine-specific translation elongation factor [Eubacteriales bacterium]